MVKKTQDLQDIFRQRRMKDMKREYYFYKMNQFWTLLKRLTLVATLGYGAHWGYKNPSKLKSFLKDHSAPVQEVSGRFKEGMGMIHRTFSENQNTASYHQHRKKQIQEYRDVGIDPCIKYAEVGSKEYAEELEFYRKAGVFKDRD